MAETIDNGEKKHQEMLKQIIKDLHAGVPAEKLQKKFKKIIRDTSPEQIAAMENALIQEGFPVSEVQRLCDVHARVFETALKRTGASSRMAGHPVHSYIEENREAGKRLKILVRLAKKVKKGVDENGVSVLNTAFDEFKQYEKHYARKENQLFPMLEAKNFTGPTKVMWGKHDEIREMIRDISGAIQTGSWDAVVSGMKELNRAVRRLVFLEEKILYPTSEKKLNEAEWAKMKLGEPEIGYAWITPSNLWDANLAKAVSVSVKPKSNEQKNVQPGKSGKVALSRGELTHEQINMLLKNLPVDITFVDENDKVCYYSDTEDRIFPRSPAIIGRAVQNCHPPASVHIVEEIVSNFKEKKKDSAEFWIKVQDNIIHIRYFPVYDDSGEYRGVIEFSQEISGIKALKGEKRLLDWSERPE